MLAKGVITLKKVSFDTCSRVDWYFVELNEGAWDKHLAGGHWNRKILDSGQVDTAVRTRILKTNFPWKTTVFM